MHLPLDVSNLNFRTKSVFQELNGNSAIITSEVMGPCIISPASAATASAAVLRHVIGNLNVINRPTLVEKSREVRRLKRFGLLSDNTIKSINLELFPSKHGRFSVKRFTGQTSFMINMTVT